MEVSANTNFNPEPHQLDGPEVGVIKINCDVAWSAALGMGGLGVIVRDHNGTL